VTGEQVESQQEELEEQSRSLSSKQLGTRPNALKKRSAFQSSRLALALSPWPSKMNERSLAEFSSAHGPPLHSSGLIRGRKRRVVRQDASRLLPRDTSPGWQGQGDTQSRLETAVAPPTEASLRRGSLRSVCAHRELLE
jgi:hypothetical protein